MMCDARVPLAVVFLGLIASAHAAPGPLTPLVPDSGPGKTTLVIHSRPAVPHSLMDLPGVVSRVLSRVVTDIVTKSATAVTEQDIASADFLVLLGAGTWPDDLPTIDPLAKPVLVLGLPPKQAADWPGSSAYRPFPPPLETWGSGSVTVGDADFTTTLGAVATGRVPGRGIDMIATARRGSRQLPLAWRRDQTVWFAALPLEDATAWALAAVLPAFYNTAHPQGSGILLSIEGVETGSDAADLRRLFDGLSAEKRPFALTLRLPNQDESPTQAHAFISTLRYAQTRQGRIFLLPRVGRFWDAARDRPPVSDAISAAVKALKEDVLRCLDAELLPLGVRLPDAGFAAAGAGTLGEIFTLAMGAAQPSDATSTVVFSPATLTRLDGRLQVIPSGNWWQPGSAEETRARNLLRLPGAILLIQVPAWLPFDEMQALVEAAAALDVPFLDPAAATATIVTDQNAVWTASARPPKVRFEGTGTLSTYDTRGQFLGKEEIPLPLDPLTSDRPGAAFYTLKPCVP